MAKKEKKISVSELEKAIGDVRPIQTEIEWNGLKILVKHMLTLEEMMMFVETASDLCFGENEQYRPELRDFAVRLNIIGMYTNIRLPESTEKKYQIVYTDGLIDAIIQNVNYEQYSDIVMSVNAKSEERVQKSHIEMQQRVNELLRSVEDAASVIGEMFQDVDREKMAAIVSSLAEHGVDENKIVEAYMHAKQDSDRNGND